MKPVDVCVVSKASNAYRVTSKGYITDVPKAKRDIYRGKTYTDTAEFKQAMRADISAKIITQVDDSKKRLAAQNQARALGVQKDYSEPFDWKPVVKWGCIGAGVLVVGIFGYKMLKSKSLTKAVSQTAQTITKPIKKVVKKVAK